LYHPLSTPPGFHAKFTASCIPVFIPCADPDE
jgi:hypothetical protein